MAKILIIGACGQIGTELVLTLREKHDNQSVIASDVRENCPEILANGPYVQLDILNREEVRNYVIEQKIEQVYQAYYPVPAYKCKKQETQFLVDYFKKYKRLPMCNHINDYNRISKLAKENLTDFLCEGEKNG